MRYRRLALVGLLAASGLPITAVSQNTTAFSISAGPSVPVARFKDTQSNGYGGALAFILGSNDNLFGLRADVGYDKLRGRTLSSGGIPSQHILSGTAALLFTISGNVIKPYLSGGLGSYRMQADTTGAKSNTRSGFNFSAGISFPFPGRSATLEAQLHSISQSNATPLRFARIVLGILL